MDSCERCGTSLNGTFCHNCGLPAGSNGNLPAQTGVTPQTALAIMQLQQKSDQDKLQLQYQNLKLQLEKEQQALALSANFQEAMGQLQLQIKSIQLGHLTPVIPFLSGGNIFSQIPGGNISLYKMSRSMNAFEGPERGAS